MTRCTVRVCADCVVTKYIMQSYVVFHKFRTVARFMGLTLEFLSVRVSTLHAQKTPYEVSRVFINSVVCFTTS